MQGVRVYSASAGAGKTFRLTAECLSLLVSNPHDYRHILAVTFTNKASEEMKERLVSELHVLASGKKSDYLTYLLSNHDVTMQEEAIRKAAAVALALLLHDYGRFSYMTIDSFFQRILRSFMRELHLNANYDLELDNSAVVSDVVDKLLDDTARDDELLFWVMNAVSLKLQESGRWDIREELKNLYSELFKEKFAYIERQYQLQRLDREAVHRLITKVDVLLATHETFRNSVYSDAIAIMQQYGLSIDDFFSKGSGPVASLMKLKKEMVDPGVRMLSARDNKEKLLHSSILSHRDANAIFQAMNAVLVRYLDWYQTNIREYNSCRLIKNQAYLLGLIVDGRRRMAEYMNENDRFFIGDTPLFLSELAEANDTPFIFEKAGLMLKHYLIDEFQDTSEKQWEAFLPLLRETIAYGDNFGMVVGDVKQSIFRWRNGNWRLLAYDIDKQLPVKRFVLDENWRSRSNIVCFNNSIFRLIPSMLQDYFNQQAGNLMEPIEPNLSTTLTHNYHDVIQLPKSGGDGLVRIYFVEKGKKDDVWKLAAMMRLAEEIDQVLAAGYAPGDIAILVRVHADASKITTFLLGYQNSETESPHARYQVVSTESLMLAANPSIIIITGLMRYLVQPDNLPALYTAVINYRLHIAHDNDCFNHITVSDNVEKLLAALPDALIEILQRKDFGDMVGLAELIIETAGLNRNPATTPFLDAFLQLLTEFSMSRGLGLYAFVDWWNSEGVKRSLQIPENRDAVRVLTIHQAKGLGFPVVFFPLCDLDLEPAKNPIMWCNTGGTPFDEIPYLPVKYMKESMANSLFFKEYYIEKLNSYQDNLNMLYVAFTRAKDALFVYCPLEKAEGSMQSYLHKAAGDETLVDEANCTALNAFFDSENQVFEMGSLPVYSKKSESVSISVSHHVNLNTRQARLKAGFARLAENGDIARGLMYHAIFEKVKHVSDIGKAVAQVAADLNLSAEKTTELLNEVQKAVQHREVQAWFDGFDELHNETWIVSPDGSLHKPDRVMRFGESYQVVDYKFGQRNDCRYEKQIRDYLDLMNTMGYQRCTGYIWYVFEQKILRINPDGVELLDLLV